MFLCSSASKSSDELPPEGRDISIQEFRKSELFRYFNSFVDDDLLIISNRNLHLKSIHEEFLKFSIFITQPLNQEHFLVFLTPVFQHLYLLLLSHKGKADADRFTTYYRYLPFPPNVLNDLLQCETCADVERLINSHGRIRVKLSSYAYHTLMNWLRDSFSKTSEMFIVLRVLHENFHVDIYHDKDDEEFAAIEYEVLQAIQKWRTDYYAEKDEKKSESEVTAETCEASENDDDVMAQKMSKLGIAAETPEMSETPEMPESTGGETNFEVKSSMFKLRDSARRYLEKVRISAKEEGWTMQQLEEALLNPPDPNVAIPAGKDDQKMDFLEDKTAVADESSGVLKFNQYIAFDQNASVLSGHGDLEMDFLEEPAISDENVVEKIIENLIVDPNEEQGLSPLEHVTSESPGDSEYIICSDASERNEEDDSEVQEIVEDTDQTLNDENDENVTVIQENVECTDQNLNDVNEDDDTEVEENVEDTDEDPNNDIDARDTDNKDKLKPQYFKFKTFYKSNFHSAYPVTISGKDVLCSSDVSPDLSYLACGFESCKICTWRVGENFKLQPISTLRGHKGIVYALSIDVNKKTLISGSHDCTVRIWDIEESKCITVISAHSAPVYAVCASPNSKYFVSASEDKHVVLYWYDEIYPVRVYTGHSQEAINCVRFHPNCAYFASASSDGNLFLFKIDEDSCPVRMFTKHITKVYTLSFSPCGKQLASADVEGLLIIWDILTCTPIKTFETGQGIRSISYDMNGSFIAALFYYKSWKIYNITEDNVDVVIEAESAGVPKSVHFSEDNKLLIIQYIEADKSEIAETKEKSKTTITLVN